MSAASNHCADCERDCSAPQCLHCVDGSYYIGTATHISYFPTFAARRVVVKGKDREVQASLISTTDRNSK